MKVVKFIQYLQGLKDRSGNKTVIVDATDRDGKLIAAFLNSNFDKSKILVISEEDKEREGSSWMGQQ